MKKILTLFLLLFSITVIHAQNDRWTIGVRGGVVFGIHKTAEFLKDVYNDPGINVVLVSEKSLINFVASVYGAINLTNWLAIQLELDFMINQGIETKHKQVTPPWETEDTMINTSLDIPILLRFAFLEKPLFGLDLGPYLSIPLGKFKAHNITTSSITPPGNSEKTLEHDIIGLNYGITFGVFFGYPLGPGRLIGNVRYYFDFFPLKGRRVTATENEIIEGTLRRGILVTAGYEISF